MRYDKHMNVRETPFDAEKFEQRLVALKGLDARPEHGKWDDTAGSKFDVSARQNEPLDPEEFKQYEGFLALGKRLVAEGKKPYVYVSY